MPSFQHLGSQGIVNKITQVSNIKYYVVEQKQEHLLVNYKIVVYHFLQLNLSVHMH